MERLAKYDLPSQIVIMYHLERIWNSWGYKDCSNVEKVWERIIEKYSASEELIALLKALGDSI